jgi:uncharacterized cupin superfamily protein
MKLVKTKDVAWAETMNQGKFNQRRKELGSTGKLSCGLWELPPGKKSFPFHKHHVTEEAMFVVSGTGKVRTATGLEAIGPGDWVGFPPGDAHQLVNDGAEPLVYLAMGVSMGVDVVEYPDSGKVASSVQQGEGRKRYIFKEDTQAQYFDGENDAKA